jgi:hypothetical protein
VAKISHGAEFGKWALVQYRVTNLNRSQEFVTVQKLAGVQMSVSGCPATINFLESRNPAKTVTKK